ncbi:hypothetical protein LQW54_006336 [Pestalotiopsis sp. IQ-011]
MSGTIQKVALAGATGNLGPSILEQLLKAGFAVTVLTRQGGSSKHQFPANVTVKEVDYDSLESLTEALRGQDAAVSTLASLALEKQILLVQAASKAGVQRFIPSEFGSNTVHPKTSQLPVFKDKVAVQDVLKKEAEAGRLTYSLIINGGFFDWGLRIGWIANAKDRSIVLHDGGDRRFSTTTLATVGQAVAGVLRHPEETKNRAIYVQSASPTLKQLVEIGERATGGKWQRSQASVDEQLKEAWVSLTSDKPDPNVFVMKFLNASVWGEGYGNPWEKTDNELLGIKELSDSDIEALIKSLA